MASVARKFGFYTKSADHVLRKMWTNMSTLPGCIYRRCVNARFW